MKKYLFIGNVCLLEFFVYFVSLFIPNRKEKEEKNIYGMGEGEKEPIKKMKKYECCLQQL